MKNASRGFVIVSPLEIKRPMPGIDAREVRRRGAVREENAELLARGMRLLQEAGVKTRDWATPELVQAKAGANPELIYLALRQATWHPQYANAGERLAVIKTLVKNGYAVRVLKPTAPNLAGKYDEFLSRARKLGAKMLETGERDEQLVDWVRDHSTQLGGKVYLSPKATHDYMKALGENSARKRLQIGEGGNLIVGSGFALIPKKAGDENARELAQQGFKVYRMPSKIMPTALMYHPGRPTEMQALQESWHLDLHVNAAPRRGIILADSSYYTLNKERLDDIARKHKQKLVIVPPEETRLLPTNFVELPDGKLLLNNAPATIARLREAGLKEDDYIRMPNAVRFNHYGNGGMRCFTQVVKVEPREKKRRRR